MALTDPPVVTIGTTTLASSWSVTERIALGGLKITWGRKSHLEKARAAQLYLEVLDTDGHLSSATHLTGQPITVTRGDGRIIFRGRVDDYDVDHIHVIDPANNARRRVWKLTLTAGCKIAELGQAVLPGSGNMPAVVEQFGPNYWEANGPAERLAELMAAGADDIVASITWSNPYPAIPSKQPFVRWRSLSDGFSALDHIEALYQAAPLGYVVYQPYNNTIVLGAPTETTGLALTYSAGILSIDFADGVAGRSIPARTIAMPNGYKARTGIQDAIDVVAVTSPRFTDWNDWYTVEHATSRKDAATGRREHRVENDVIVFVDQAEDVGDFEWPFPLTEVTAEYGSRPGIGDGWHDGIDFSGTTATEGADIPAAGPGTYAGRRTHPDWGNNVIIDHGLDVNGDRLRTVYCHLETQPTYPIGERFDKGETIGQLGNTGLSTGPHLHFETLVNGAAVNPRTFMQNKQYGENATTTYVDTWQTSLAEDTAALLDQLNEKLTLPTVRFDFRNFEYHPNVEALAIETYVIPDRALYFPGSVFNIALDSAAAHQIIGGTLVYFEGWTHDVTLAPAISTAGPGITIAELCAADAPTLSQFDPDITIADLGNVSQGVPA